MAKFRADPIRNYTPDGRLVAAGLEWVEGRPYRAGSLAVSGGFAVYGAVSCVVMSYISNSVTCLWVGMFFGLMAVVLFDRLYECRGKPRALVFHDGGAVFGLPGEHFEPHNNGHIGSHTGIANIGIWSVGFEHLIVIYSVDGSACTAARGLDHWQALKVAVELTNALQEIRDATGSSAAARGRSRARQPID
jgi:hypothetical protein